MQTYLGDPDIQSKIDFEIRTNFLIHGWMSGLDGGNRYLPAEVRESDGKSLNNSDYVDRWVKYSLHLQVGCVRRHIFGRKWKIVMFVQSIGAV